ncbi:hypothetical protein [Lentzea guizhouensis]|uniref:hypothetical protein n=1 Tax=Lentzea guizhouensis TaxID=1586287 RepID=UPI0008FF6415
MPRATTPAGGRVALPPCHHAEVDQRPAQLEPGGEPRSTRTLLQVRAPAAPAVTRPSARNAMPNALGAPQILASSTSSSANRRARSPSPSAAHATAAPERHASAAGLR